MTILMYALVTLIAFFTGDYLTKYLVLKYPEYKMDSKYLMTINILAVIFAIFIQNRLISNESFSALNVMVKFAVTASMGVLSGTIASSFMIDCLFKELPDENNFIIGLTIAPISLYIFGYKVIFTALILFAVSFVFAYITGQLGMGDVKMMFFMGLGFLPDKILAFIFTSFGIAYVYCIFKLIKTKFKRKQYFAFGPYLILGFMSVILL